MTKANQNSRNFGGVIFLVFFILSTAIGAASSFTESAYAAPALQEPGPSKTYAGSSSCYSCHKDIHDDWVSTLHAQAFSTPIFQRDWSELSLQTSCLECHTTGFDPTTGSYAEEGVTCEACHGPFQPNHPVQKMPIEPDANLCATCHKGTTDEWRASIHSQAGIQCQACHNPHAQTPMAESVTGLCSNCHKEYGSTFTHGTHSSAGLECSNCHMYTAPRTEDPIGGLVPTGHTYSVGSEACVGCHQETVHSRDEIIKLTGEIEAAQEINVEALKQTILEQEGMIDNLQSSATVRLYTGLTQGAIVGLITGGMAAWVVSRRIRVVEVEEDE